MEKSTNEIPIISYGFYLPNDEHVDLQGKSHYDGIYFNKIFLNELWRQDPGRCTIMRRQFDRFQRLYRPAFTGSSGIDEAFVVQVLNGIWIGFIDMPTKMLVATGIPWDTNQEEYRRIIEAYESRGFSIRLTYLTPIGEDLANLSDEDFKKNYGSRRYS